MAEQTRDKPTQTEDRARDENLSRKTEPRGLKGGTEEGEVARLIGPDSMAEGTPGIGSPAGGVHVKSPPATVPTTTQGTHINDGDTLRLAGGKTPDMVLSYLEGVQFPAKKDVLIHAARQKGAPEDVLWGLFQMIPIDYASPDEVIREYPRLQGR